MRRCASATSPDYAVAGVREMATARWPASRTRRNGSSDVCGVASPSLGACRPLPLPPLSLFLSFFLPHTLSQVYSQVLIAVIHFLSLALLTTVEDRWYNEHTYTQSNSNDCPRPSSSYLPPPPPTAVRSGEESEKGEGERGEEEASLCWRLRLPTSLSFAMSWRCGSHAPPSKGGPLVSSSSLSYFCPRRSHCLRRASSHDPAK